MLECASIWCGFILSCARLILCFFQAIENKKAGLSLLCCMGELSETLNLRQPTMFIFGFAPLNIVQRLA